MSEVQTSPEMWVFWSVERTDGGLGHTGGVRRVHHLPSDGQTPVPP